MRELAIERQQWCGGAGERGSGGSALRLRSGQASLTDRGASGAEEQGRSIINYQLSIIHYPLSIIHYQLSSINYQLSITPQPTTTN